MSAGVRKCGPLLDRTDVERSTVYDVFLKEGERVRMRKARVANAAKTVNNREENIGGKLLDVNLGDNVYLVKWLPQ